MDNGQPSSFLRQLSLPVLFVVLTLWALFFGFQAGILYSHKSNNFSNDNTEENDKLSLILNYIENNYVDSVNIDELQNDAIADLLHHLDPHSEFIPPHDFTSIQEQMTGNFEGIGIEFNIINDTIRVIQTISNGPSEKAGLMAGDKIISVNDSNVAGVKITNEQVLKKLRGKKGTKVKLGILRPSVKNVLYFTIQRDEIPLYSVDVYYLLKNDIGYIRIDRFAQNTVKEFENALKSLLKQGMKKLVLDLRDNPGGLLDAAVSIADHFLEDGTLIVYTQGRKYPKKEFKATSRGLFETQPLVVIINEGSASASEIVAGAIQDNDRAVIVGRRSFGKGLVQEELNLPDGSAIRLTIARYYTPTGRCIQKPYKKKSLADYYMEEYDRHFNGEVVKIDSSKIDTTQKFITPKGKIVYGGGGILPDIFIPEDTSIHNFKINKLLANGCIQQYAFHFVDANRKSLMQMYPNDQQFINKYSIDDKMIKEMVYQCQQTKKKFQSFNDQEWAKLKTLLKAHIGRLLYGNAGYYPVINKTDKTIQKAIELLENEKN